MAAREKDIDQGKVDHLLASMGFIFPRTEDELDSFDELYSGYEFEIKDFKIDSEKLIKKNEPLDDEGITTFNHENNKNTYFKRVVLAAEIASQLYNEPTFGNVKFQKLVFLCENIRGININYQYSKQAAGPYDNRFMHSIHSAFEKQKWFKVKREKVGNMTRYVFVPLEKLNDHKSYYNGYFRKYQDKIQWIIDTFRKERTQIVELIATLYACWIELESRKIPVTDAGLLNLLYTWSEEKQKYSEETALKAIYWMKEIGLIPE